MSLERIKQAELHQSHSDLKLRIPIGNFKDQNLFYRDWKLNQIHYQIIKNWTQIARKWQEMAIQRGNAICVTTCVKDQSSGLEGLFNFQVHVDEEL